ncbi:HNH endonuclease [Macrococcoides canis]|uniref:HNH nuclease domain-containing protein n=1 Tax=Macrococcoides canis TaxID=1855823 RepID=A0A4R6C6R5_9STAP|nr:HNH endonuclease [Macrococcus canis]TDM18108.1 hypothetical protein ETI04_01060 [Macrococcus canis]
MKIKQTRQVFIPWDESKSTFHISDTGYALVHLPNHPNARNNGCVSRARLVMENYLGRYLDLNETVYRINKDRLDDRLENLKLSKPTFYSWEDYESDEWFKIPTQDGYVITNYGKVKRIKDNRILSGYLNQAGYVMFHINGKARRAHRLVAETFLENKHGYELVNHKNGIKTDNRVENLEWCDRLHNNQHAYETGLMKMNRKFKKLSNEDVARIREMHKSGKYMLKELADMFGISPSHAGGICRNETRKM